VYRSGHDGENAENNDANPHGLSYFRPRSVAGFCFAIRSSS
jgi:hypothetical protein